MTRRPRAPVLPPPALGDECPDCRADHRHLANPARHYNPYTQDTTQHTKEPAMTIQPTATPEPAPATLAIRDGDTWWSKRQLAALNQLGIGNAPDGDLLVFFHFCQRTGLDPFARQVTMISYGGKWTIQTEIDGYRAIARRAARTNGQVISYAPTVWLDAEGKEYPYWVVRGAPAAAKVSVYVDGAPFHGYASYHEFVPLSKDGKPMGLWAKMPANQLAKCAEAQALRKAFPQDLADTITGTEAPPPAAAWDESAPAVQATPEPRRRGKQPHIDQGEQGINLPPAHVLRSEWERLSITDLDEQLNLTQALTGGDSGIIIDSLDDLPATELRRIYAHVANCPTIGDVHRLIAGGEAPPS